MSELVADYDSNEQFQESLGETIVRALVENWKPSKAKAAVEVASRYTLCVQCERILDGVDTLAGQ